MTQEEPLYSKTFEKIPEEKKIRIYEAAADEFSSLGYNGANVNVIAKKAGVSIGSLYSYFSSKDNLLLTLVDYYIESLRRSVEEEVNMNGDCYEVLYWTLISIINHAKAHPAMTRIYQEISTEGLNHLAHKLSYRLESATARLYKSVIARGQKEGRIRKDVDPGYIMFCIDNILMYTQFSYCSAYHKERLGIYAGAEAIENPTLLAENVVRFIRYGLEPKK